MISKICIITASRSEYGHLKWIIDVVANDLELELQLVVTGAHLSEEQGNTIDAIKADGYLIAAQVNMRLDNQTQASIVRSMGYCSEGLADVFEELNPDILIVLGDRYELLSICSAALVMGIPIAHLSGGDVTEGAIDNTIRNAVTMMASVHFPGVSDSAENIARMIGNKDNIYVVGEPTLETLVRLPLLNREELAVELELDIAKNWVMLTYHPETRSGLNENMLAVQNIITALDMTLDTQIVISKANADYGGWQINQYLEQVVEKNPAKYKIYASLGQLRYLSYMKQVQFIIGNSSSGIVEAPFLNIPAINVGDRQKGRYLCQNVIQTSQNLSEIKKAIQMAENNNFSKDDCYYWGDGNTALKVVSIVKKYVLDNRR